jgi:hypothetical protein
MDYKLLLLFIPLLLFGCIEDPQPLPDITNGTEPGFSKYSGIGTSFEFPKNMMITHKIDEYEFGRGSASVNGIKNPPNKTLLTLIYSNTGLYGSQIASSEPTTAVVDFLKTDSLSDPAGMLSNAQDVSEISNSTLGNYVVAQLTFSMNLMGMDGNPVKYSGYAINFYNPDKSALYRLRILSEDGSYSKTVKDKFLESFSG